MQFALGDILGDMDEDNFEASTCKPDSSKGGIYRVYLTVPIELRNHYRKKQLKKSTGERDGKKAKRKQHNITEQWYREFRELLGKDAYAKLVKILALEQTFFCERFHPNLAHPQDGEDVECVCFPARPKDQREASHAIDGFAQRIREYQTAKENHDGFYFLDSGILKAEVERGHTIHFDEIEVLQKIVKFELLQQFPLETALQSPANLTSVPIAPNKTLYPKPSEFVEAYFSHRKWDSITAKQKKSSQTRIEECLSIIGDPPLDQMLAQHGFKIAETLEKVGKANVTIKSYISALSGLLDHIRLNELNTDVVPNKAWLTSNPFIGLPLSGYGTSKRSFEAFTVDQLHELFAQRMKTQDRMCLELLVTTGCRLDEIALLTWEQIKTDNMGIRYIDLASAALVKNSNSKRLVPIPDIIILPERSTGRLFDYRVDSSGKASHAAGKTLLRKYIHPIRSGSDDNRKTVHSLRHNLVGFLDNLSPAVSESLKDWITGHSSEGVLNDSERKRTYGSDPDLSLKYEALNRIKHPWLKYRN